MGLALVEVGVAVASAMGRVVMVGVIVVVVMMVVVVMVSTVVVLVWFEVLTVEVLVTEF